LANPVLAPGEWGLETDSGKVKIGDGTTVWTTLDYTPQGLQRFDFPALFDIPPGTGTPSGWNPVAVAWQDLVVVPAYTPVSIWMTGEVNQPPGTSAVQLAIIGTFDAPSNGDPIALPSVSRLGMLASTQAGWAWVPALSSIGLMSPVDVALSVEVACFDTADASYVPGGECRNMTFMVASAS
jgi:hypothetical protein